MDALTTNNVILSGAKNLGWILDRAATEIKQRCFAPLNMTRHGHALVSDAADPVPRALPIKSVFQERRDRRRLELLAAMKEFQLN